MAFKIHIFAEDLHSFLCFGALNEIILDNITEMPSTIAKNDHLQHNETNTPTYVSHILLARRKLVSVPGNDVS